MQNIKTTVHAENRQVEVSLTAFVPMAEIKEASAEERIEARRKERARQYDLIGSFSEMIIKSVERRMQACQAQLLEHISEGKGYGESVFVWVDKRGVTRTFNLTSYKLMEDVVKSLKQSDWRFLCTTGPAKVQVVKALMNDPEQDHSDRGDFHYSELVSFLTENLF